ASVCVAPFDQQPLARSGPHQGPSPLELVAVEPEAQLALPQRDGGIDVVEHLVDALVPDHHRAATIFALGDHALEARVFERLILDLHRETFLARIKGRTLRHRPRRHRVADLEPEVVMQRRRAMLLDDEAATRRRSCTTRRWLRRTREVALALVLGEPDARRALRSWDASPPSRQSAPYGPASRFSRCTRVAKPVPVYRTDVLSYRDHGERRHLSRDHGEERAHARAGHALRLEPQPLLRMRAGLRVLLRP